MLLLSSTVASKNAKETDSNSSFFSIPTGRNNSDPRLFLPTGIFYGLILFLPSTIFFISESLHTTAIYTNIVLSTDCVCGYRGCHDIGLKVQIGDIYCEGVIEIFFIHTVEESSI